MNYVYILTCHDGTLYTGWTNHLKERVQAHNGEGAGAKYTRGRRPVQLSYYEGYETKQEAMRREAAIKKLGRSQKLELISFGSVKGSGTAPQGAEQNVASL